MNKKVILLIFLAALLFISSSLFVSFTSVYGKIFPNFFVGEINISSMSLEQARKTLENEYNYPENLTLFVGEEEIQLSLQEIELEYNIDKSVAEAYSYYRNGNVLSYLSGFITSIASSKNIDISYSYNEEKLQTLLSAIATQVEDQPIYPTALIENNDVIVNPGNKGTELDRNVLLKDIDSAISSANFQPIPITINEIDPTLDDGQINQFKLLANKIAGKNLSLLVEKEKVILSTNDILKLLNYDGSPKENDFEEFIDTFSQNHNKEPQNSVFEYTGNSVEEFIPSRDGVRIEKDKFSEEMRSAINELIDSSLDSVELEVPYSAVPPEITTDQVNDLGINELIGKGSSNFRGSIASRVHNIGVASNKFNGTLVKPGDVVSFNNILGDVSEYTGYKKAYVIKNGQTVLGDGGGVCQVSTTLFRAALDAGLPINERRAHSYRVTYYEQGYPPGLDATVYAPTTDLKFQNDTPGHLLIQTIYDPANATLDFEIYGTDDGRIASITEPIITSSSPPPEDLYIDDPTLPEGQTKQIDWKAWGAKVNFDYSVERDGKMIYEKTFYSNFQPWQAKFLRGTAPVN